MAASVNRRTQLPLVGDCLSMIKGMNWATAEPDDTPRRWRRRMLFAGITLAGLSLAAGSVFWLTWQSQLNRQIQAIRDAASLSRSQSWTLTIRRRRQIRMQRIYGCAWRRAACGRRNRLGMGIAILRNESRSATARTILGELERSRQFLAANAEAMRQLHEAVVLGGQARFPGSLNTRTAATSGWLTRCEQMRACGRALMLETDVCDMRTPAAALRNRAAPVRSLPNRWPASR